MGKFFKTAAQLIVVTGTRGSGKTTYARTLDPNFIETDKIYRKALTKQGFIKLLLEELSKYNTSDKVVIEGAILNDPEVTRELKQHHTIFDVVKLSPSADDLKLYRQKRRDSYNLGPLMRTMLKPKWALEDKYWDLKYK